MFEFCVLRFSHEFLTDVSEKMVCGAPSGADNDTTKQKIERRKFFYSQQHNHQQSSLSIVYFLFAGLTMMMFRLALLTTLAFSIRVTAAFCPAPAFLHSSSRVVQVVEQQHGTTALRGAVDTSDIKTGMTVELDGEPFKILTFSIMKQARGAAKTTIKFKNLVRGTTIENTYRSGEKFQTAEITKIVHQFTYSDEVSTILFTSRSYQE
jgi:hypothetical protein